MKPEVVDTYPLYLDAVFKLSMIVAFLVMFVIPLSSAVFLQNGNVGGLPLPATILYLVGILLALYWYLAFPYRIEMLASERIRFVRLIRNIELSPGEIESIKPMLGSFGILTLRHRGGRFRLINQFDGFHKFLTHLESQNPHVEVRGC